MGMQHSMDRLLVSKKLVVPISRYITYAYNNGAPSQCLYLCILCSCVCGVIVFACLCPRARLCARLRSL